MCFIYIYVQVYWIKIGVFGETDHRQSVACWIFNATDKYKVHFDTRVTKFYDAAAYKFNGYANHIQQVKFCL